MLNSIEPWVFWVVVAGMLAVAEMMSGTFYLLLAALGALAAGAASFVGAGMTVQILIAAGVTLANWFVLKKIRPDQTATDHRRNPDVNSDIGETVRIQSIDPSGKIKVFHRGAHWDAAMDNGYPAELNVDYIISKIDGIKLILSPKN